MSIVETIQKSRHLGKDYNSRLELLYKESFEILQSKSAKKEEIIDFIQHVILTEYQIDSSNWIGRTSNQIKLSIKIDNNCLEIIKKYDIDDLRIRQNVLYSVEYYEENTERKKELQKELISVERQLKELGLL